MPARKQADALWHNSGTPQNCSCISPHLGANTSFSWDLLLVTIFRKQALCYSNQSSHGKHRFHHCHLKRGKFSVFQENHLVSSASDKKTCCPSSAFKHISYKTCRAEAVSSYRTGSNIPKCPQKGCCNRARWPVHIKFWLIHTSASLWHCYVSSSLFFKSYFNLFQLQLLKFLIFQNAL